MESYNLVSFAGIFVLLAFAWLFSSDRRNMNWRVIGWGIGLQMIFALFIFLFPPGVKVFLVVNDVVVKVMESASAGTRFQAGQAQKASAALLPQCAPRAMDCAL